jgi:hypothetical protein
MDMLFCAGAYPAGVQLRATYRGAVAAAAGHQLTVRAADPRTIQRAGILLRSFSTSAVFLISKSSVKMWVFRMNALVTYITHVEPVS